MELKIVPYDSPCHGRPGCQWIAFAECGLWLSAFIDEGQQDLCAGWLAYAKRECDALDQSVMGFPNCLHEACKLFVETTSVCLDMGWASIDQRLCRRFGTVDKYGQKCIVTITEADGQICLVRVAVEAFAMNAQAA